MKHKLLSFQPTYEELKLSVLAGISITTVGFQPTYEELKLYNVAFAVAAIARFQPTYEELKREWQSLIRLGELMVSSLPMRN